MKEDGMSKTLAYYAEAEPWEHLGVLRRLGLRDKEAEGRLT